ncbi:SHOCT domain-containing protein [Subtercola lobariae]|uniref:SHOCT domain-containing protein n=1 Tax=Subtercola lobariae TaxID=1588641 RepID=A0A917BA31_9MICO|nr:SHOCT domain-containing protein [Subtercola lobariae]GGF28063.1 hypothetical protein GCM10011399_21650 [Subtercola lobariae]
MDVVLSAPGLTPVAARYSHAIVTSKWPEPGMTLPASIDPANPQKFTILWQQLNSGPESGHRRAEDIAAQMKAPDRSAAHVEETPAQGDERQQISLNGSPIDSSQVDTEALWRNFDGLMAAASSSSAPLSRPAQTTDVAPLLDRLASLRDRGILTQAEFEAQKQKLLSL